MLSLFGGTDNKAAKQFLRALKQSSLKALNNKCARLRDKIAFAKTEAIRQQNRELLKAVEDEIKSRLQGQIEA